MKDVNMSILETTDSAPEPKSKKTPTSTVKIVFDLPIDILTTETLSVASRSDAVVIADILSKFNGIDKEEVLEDLERNDVITIASTKIPHCNGACEELMVIASELVRFLNMCYQPVSFRLEKRRLEDDIFKLLVKDFNTDKTLECSNETIMRLAGFNYCDSKCKHSRAINLNGTEYYPIPGGHGECLQVLRLSPGLELLPTSVRFIEDREGYSIETDISKTTFKPMSIIIDRWYQFTYIAS